MSGNVFRKHTHRIESRTGSKLQAKGSLKCVIIEDDTVRPKCVVIIEAVRCKVSAGGLKQLFIEV